MALDAAKRIWLLDPNPIPIYITLNILPIGNGLVVAQLG